MELLTLRFKYPELDFKSVVLTSIPPRYQTDLLISGRFLWRIENENNFELNYKQLDQMVLEYGIQKLIQESKQP